MMASKRASDIPVDENIIVRYFHLHCLKFISQVFRSTNVEQWFSLPRFKLFRTIKKMYHRKENKHSLFKNILYSFQYQILVGAFITIIFASLNLLAPNMIREFLHYMKEYTHDEEGNWFLLKFFALQFSRIIFGQHAKRLFTELAIQVESALARKLVAKSLKNAREFRDKIPQSQIIQLENVDLKLVSTLFKNMYLFFESPFTIFVAIAMLFLESSTYGIIGIYWFLIAFLLQRQLDGKMTHCNQTKLGLIDRRSKINYQLLSKIKQAKVANRQDILVEKNNDLFIEENHDHHLFYFYSTLYVITLLMRPILVVVTITLFDLNSVKPITVEEVYVMLTLLGICYNPMKNFRTISISLHDGLHSLERLQEYFNLPDDIPSDLIERAHGQTEITIMKNTVSVYPHSEYDFQIKVTEQIELRKGQRLIVLGRKAQGNSSFLQMLIGNMKRVEGKIFIGGKVAYCGENDFFINDTVQNNIRFFNKDTTNQKIQMVYEQMGLGQQLKYMQGLRTHMDDDHMFTDSQRKKISLARLFCSDADIYILDSPFLPFDQETTLNVERMLRIKQRQGKIIAMTLKALSCVEPQDHIVIMMDGQTVEYGRFCELLQKQSSSISKFFKDKDQKENSSEPKSARVIQAFRRNVKLAMKTNLALKKMHERAKPASMLQSLLSQSFTMAKEQKKAEKEHEKKKRFLWMLWKFLRSMRVSEAVYILSIILVAELLHIFIHFYIGHLEEDHGSDGYTKFRNMMLIEVILTFALAGIIYLQGEVSSRIAIIRGNTLYKESLISLVRKDMSWFNEQYSVKIADRFNHDYEEVFIALHMMLNIYKNVVILVATLEFVSTNRSSLVFMTLIVAIIYLTIFLCLRNVEQKVVKHYYDYKYRFVRVFEESIEGSLLFGIFNVKQEVIRKAQQAYQQLATYKLAESYTSYGVDILCDLVSLSLLLAAFYYGLQMKMYGSEANIALIATTIHLLMNLSQVLKTIVKLTVQFQTFFQINLIPFIEIIDTDKKPHLLREFNSNNAIENNSSSSYAIRFYKMIIEDQNILHREPHNPLTFTIRERERVVIIDFNDKNRASLLYALTKNLPKQNIDPKYNTEWQKTITIGYEDVSAKTSKEMMQLVGIITNDNFFLTGTLRENIEWGLRPVQESEVDKFVRILRLNTDLQDYEDKGLESSIEAIDGKVNSEVIKKIAMLRILLHRPKIVIIKDTHSFIDSKTVTDILDRHHNDCTIIKISNKFESVFDMNRIIYMQNLNIKQDDTLQQLLQKDNFIGRKLKECNIDGYLYMNKVSITPRKIRTKNQMNSPFKGSSPFRGGNAHRQGTVVQFFRTGNSPPLRDHN